MTEYVPKRKWLCDCCPPVHKVWVYRDFELMPPLPRRAIPEPPK